MIGTVQRIPIGYTSTGVAPIVQGATPTGAISTLPEWNYTPTAGLADSSSAYLGDYYGQMANTYLPQIDTFAQQNAGNMVDWDSDRFMSIGDFGYDTARGKLRGAVTDGSFTVGGNYQNSYGDTQEDGTFNAIYYTRDGQPLGIFDDGSGNMRESVQDGDEVFTRTPNLAGAVWQGRLPEYNYTSAGAYHKETPEEAFQRKLSQGGDFAGTDKDGGFGGNHTLNKLTDDVSKGSKWGADPVNMPELAQYINDPSWVVRGDDGRITSMRAELLPYVFREQIGEEFRDISRGSTEAAAGIGELVGMLVVGAATWGMGVAASAGLGLTTAGTTATGLTGALTGGTALSTTGSIVAGGVTGGLSAAARGGNIGQGILTGGIAGGVAPLVSQGVANTGIEWLGSGTLANNALSRGATAALRAGVSGGDAGTGFLSGAGTSLVTETMAYNGLTTGVGAIDGAIGSLINQTFTGALTPSATQSTDEQPVEEQPVEEQPVEDTFASVAVPVRSSYFRSRR